MSKLARKLLPAALALGSLFLGSAASAEVVDDGGAYCRKNGGVSGLYRFYGNTNADPAAWLEYGGPAVRLCAFSSPPDPTGFQSRIWIANTTLVSTKPTAAALVLHRRPAVPWPEFNGSNPSHEICESLGGASWDKWGPGANGSGWARSPTDEDGPTNLCVFADGSMVDTWGIAYWVFGQVRGIDLTTVLRFKNPF